MLEKKDTDTLPLNFIIDGVLGNYQSDEIRIDFPRSTGPGVYDAIYGYGFPTGIPQPIPGLVPEGRVVVELSSEFQLLLDEVRALRVELNSIPTVSSVMISALNSETVEVIKPISILIEESVDECLVRWPETNAYGIAPTLQWAIVDLKKNILELYLDITSREKSDLGIIALQTLDTLQSYIRETE